MTRPCSLALFLLFPALLLGCGGEGKSGAILAVNPGDPPEKTGVPAGQTGGREGPSADAKANGVQANAAGPLDFARPIHLLGHKPAAIVGLAYSPDGNHLASISDTGEVILWDLAKRSRSSLAAGGSPNSGGLSRFGEHVAFSPDGKTLFFGTVSAATQWDVGSGNSVHTFSHTKVEGYTDGMVIAPDRKTLVTYGGDGEGGESWKVWDVATKEAIFNASLPSDVHWRYSPDSKTLVVTPRGKIHVYDLAKRRELTPIQDDAKDLFFIDNNSLSVWGEKLSVWDLGDRTGPARLKSREDLRGDLDRTPTSWGGGRLLSPDRKSLVGLVGGAYHVGDFATRKSRGVVRTTEPLVFTPDSGTIVAPTLNASSRQNVFLAEADAQTGQTREVLEIAYDGAKPEVSSDIVLAISPTRAGTITVGLRNGLIVIHPLVGKTPGLKELASLPLTPMGGYGQRAKVEHLRQAKDGRPYALEFSHDSRYVALLGMENLLWDVASKKLVLTATQVPPTNKFPRPTFAIAPWPTVMVVPDQDLVLSANVGETLCRYALSTGELKSRQDHKDTMCYASFRMAPDGKTAAALIADEKVRRYPSRTYKLALVDPATLKIKTELATFEAPGDSPGGDVAFSATARYWPFAPACQSTTFVSWDLATRQEKPTTSKGAGLAPC